MSRTTSDISNQAPGIIGGLYTKERGDSRATKDGCHEQLKAMLYYMMEIFRELSGIHSKQNWRGDIQTQG